MQVSLRKNKCLYEYKKRKDEIFHSNLFTALKIRHFKKLSQNFSKPQCNHCHTFLKKQKIPKN